MARSSSMAGCNGSSNSHTLLLSRKFGNGGLRKLAQRTLGGQRIPVCFTVADEEVRYSMSGGRSNPEPAYVLYHAYSKAQ